MLSPRLWTILLSFTAAVLVLMISEIVVSYDHAVQDGFEETNLITSSFQERVIRVFDATDEVLGNMLPEFASSHGPDAKKERDYHLLFRSKLTQMPYVTAFYVVDKQGNMIANSSEFPTRRSSLKDRPHIRIHFESSESSTFVGEISKSVVNGKMFIPVTRKIFNKTGDLVGVLGAALSPTSFQSFTKEFSIPEGAATVLFRKNGVKLSSSSEDVIPSHFEKMLENSRGQYRESFSGVKRFVSYSWVTNRPLLVATYLPDKNVFSAWFIESSLKILATLLTLIAIFGTLVYTFHQQKRQLTEARRTFQNYQLLTSLLEKSSDKMGMAYFESICRLLADFLKVDQVFVGEVSNRSPLKVRTIAYLSAGKFQPEIEYLIKETPCERVLQGEYGVYPDHLQKIFPQDQIIVDLNLHSYAGVPLKTGDGTIIGIFTILDKKAMPDAQNHRALMSILAHRLGAELDRYQRDRSRLSKSTSRQSVA